MRVVIIGTGIRALGFARAIVDEKWTGDAELVGLVDLNPVRMTAFCGLLGRAVPGFTSINEAVHATAPATAIVCTPDHSHPEVIEQALAAGLDVISEKPLAVDREGISRILSAEQGAGRPIQVAFNYRYLPFVAKLKSLLRQAPLGPIYSVNLEWFIDIDHGQEYFRRWHAFRSCSGGLLVHKATHHFDLLNWLLEDEPQRVSATAGRHIFGDAGAVAGSYCRACEHRDTCWAAMRSSRLDDPDLAREQDQEILRKLYFDAEGVDGYRRDRCVFGRAIDIPDTMHAWIEYARGTQVSYTLTSYAPYAGFRITLTGQGGRIEAQYITPATRPLELGTSDTIRLVTGTHHGDIRMEEVAVVQESGPHGGADERLCRHLFGIDADDPLGQQAGSAAGARSALIGICANESLDLGRPIAIPTLAELTPPLALSGA